MLTEKIVESKIGKLIMANTDGAEFLVKKTDLEIFYNLCNEWELESNNFNYGRLEYGEYKFIAQLSVNDYIAEDVKGSIKRKGSFMTYEDIKANNWHKDSSGGIIPLALEKYFVNNIPIEETITSCNNIFEFCYGAGRKKAAKKGEFKWLISEVTESNLVKSYLSEDRFMRYYMGGNTTINKLYDDGEIKNLSTKGNAVTICQYLRREEIEKGDINYYPNLNKRFYINECNEIIKLIEK